MDEVDWIDLPNDSYLAILGYETKNTIEIDQLIRKYNEFAKDEMTLLSHRIRALEDIVDKIHVWVNLELEQKDKKKHLIWISEIATRKKNYLTQLLEIYQNKLHEEEAQQRYHTDISSLPDLSKIPVFLNNHRFFSLKMREYWGDFWFESLDPCHRRLTPFLDQWRTLKKADPKTPHFFLWLENQHIPKYVPRVTYLQGEDLERCRLSVNDGLFWMHNENWIAKAEFNAPSTRYLFAIDLEGEIYVAEEAHGISHSSFTSGQPVLGAGLLRISEGVLYSVALESGHYMPSLEIGYQILKIFEEKGVVFPAELEVVYFHDRNKHKININTNPLPSLEEFNELLVANVLLKTQNCS